MFRRDVVDPLFAQETGLLSPVCAFLWCGGKKDEEVFHNMYINWWFLYGYYNSTKLPVFAFYCYHQRE